MIAHPIRILGLDPGLRHTGWGLIEAEGARLRHLASGTLSPPAEGSLAERLAVLFRAVEAVVAEHAPQEAAIEETFVSKDAKATLKLGHARGIAMLAPALAGVPVAEYAPNQVKKTVTGVGHGDKKQIQAMIRVLLPQARPGSEHAADALAIAICHAHLRGQAMLAARVVGGA